MKLFKKIKDWFNAEDVESQMGGNILTSFFRIIGVAVLVIIGSILLIVKLLK
jgi:hypothetical protein